MKHCLARCRSRRAAAERAPPLLFNRIASRGGIYPGRLSAAFDGMPSDGAHDATAAFGTAPALSPLFFPAMRHLRRRWRRKRCIGRQMSGQPQRRVRQRFCNNLHHHGASCCATACARSPPAPQCAMSASVPCVQDHSLRLIIRGGSSGVLQSYDQSVQCEQTQYGASFVVTNRLILLNR
jgi:hypothetical protein